jgi:hypothetical protein
MNIIAEYHISTKLSTIHFECLIESSGIIVENFKVIHRGLKSVDNFLLWARFHFKGNGYFISRSGISNPFSSIKKKPLRTDIVRGDSIRVCTDSIS